MSKLNIGIIGCGEATQVIHIPTLSQLADQFTITAIHDASPTVAAALRNLLPNVTAHPSSDALIDDRNVDAVLIAGPNALHAPQAIAAMKAGKHVLIEKPMCMTMAEGEAMAEVQAKTGRVAQIGYMRRHALEFEEAVRLVAPHRDKINFARVHDIIGPNSAFIAPTSNVIRGTDIPSDIAAATTTAEAAALKSVAGTSEGPRALIYRLLLGLSTHDLSAMREILGAPKRVLSANYRGNGLFYTAQFDYGNFICQFETGIDHIARFGAHIEVLLPDKEIRVDYDTPYIRHQATRLSVTEAKGAHGVSVAQSYTTRQDSFIVEWQRFHASVTQGAPVKTDIADAQLDLRLLSDIMAKMEG